MPVILEFEYADGTTEVFRMPAEIWKFGSDEVTKVFPTDKEVKNIDIKYALITAAISPPRAPSIVLFGEIFSYNLFLPIVLPTK